jgi:hypothetical protein
MQRCVIFTFFMKQYENTAITWYNQEMGANSEFLPRALRPDTQKITQK